MSSLFLALCSLLVSSTLALPAVSTPRRFSARHNAGRSVHSVGMRAVTGSVGLGDNSDLLYTVPIRLGNTTTLVNLDTGSSDLWVISTDCFANSCAKARTTMVPAQELQTTGASVMMRYGDSTTGTYATGPIAMETVSIAGVAIEKQMFAAINDTTNAVVQFGAAGIFGLGFPSGSQIQGASVINQFGKSSTTDHFVASSYADGPLISRIAQSGALDMPMFTISLQRSTIDISGTGALTLGTLPAGVDNSSMTWVPVRLYTPKDGGISPPTFAPNEVYPLRWEIELDGVFLNGKQLPASKVPTSGGVDSTKMSALIDTGNSILRGPADTVTSILSTISPEYDPAVPNSATLACAKAHDLSFMIGGKMFPLDPRDLIGPQSVNNAQTCIVDNLVETDAPGFGALFRWSLGDPFLKSNLVAFHYGNLTHPSQDPPRIGFKSLVPANAAELLKQAVQDALEDGGNFESTLVVAPTGTESGILPQVTVRPVSASAHAAELTDIDDPPTSTPAAKPTKAPVPAASATAGGSAGAGTPTNANANKDTKNAARRPGVWDPWCLALGAAALGAVWL